jgi:hypothetical protein
MTLLLLYSLWLLRQHVNKYRIKLLLLLLLFTCYMCIIYFTLVGPELKYPSVAWNFVTSTDANKLERIRQKTAALCFYRFFPKVHYSYFLALEQLQSQTLRTRRSHLDALSLIQVYLRSKFCHSLVETFGLRIPARYIGDFSMFNVCSSNKICPSARFASDANVVCRDVDVFGTIAIILIIFYNLYFLIINYYNIIFQHPVALVYSIYVCISPSQVQLLFSLVSLCVHWFLFLYYIFRLFAIFRYFALIY